jgi:hypothetical protein
MSKLYYKNANGTLQKLNISGDGPAISELTYSTESGRTYTFVIPTIQNIKFSQARNVTSRNTIKGEYRNQFGREQPANISFDIVMNNDLFLNIKQYLVDGDLVRTTVGDPEELADIARRSVVDITDITSGDENSYTIKQLITALRDIQMKGMRFKLTTSSPLDELLDELVITNVTFNHTADSREVVSCTVTATNVKLIEDKYTEANKIDILGMSVSATDDDAVAISENDIFLPKYDTEKAFPTSWYIRNIKSNQSYMEMLGTAMYNQFPDVQNRNFYLQKNTIEFLTTTEYICRMGMHSMWEMIASDDNNNHYTYDVRIIDLKLTVAEKTGQPALFKPQLRTTNLQAHPSNPIGGLERHYNLLHTYSQFSVNESETDGIDTKDVRDMFRAAEYQEYVKDVTTVGSTSSNFVYKDANDWIWGYNTSDKWEWKLEWSYPDENNWNDLVFIDGSAHSNPIDLTGGFDYKFFEVHSKPKLDVDRAIIGNKAYEHLYEKWGIDEGTTIPVYPVFYTLGYKAQLLLFSSGYFSTDKIAETQE